MVHFQPVFAPHHQSVPSIKDKWNQNRWEIKHEKETNLVPWWSKFNETMRYISAYMKDMFRSSVETDVQKNL